MLMGLFAGSLFYPVLSSKDMPKYKNPNYLYKQLSQINQSSSKILMTEKPLKTVKIFLAIRSVQNFRPLNNEEIMGHA